MVARLTSVSLGVNSSASAFHPIRICSVDGIGCAYVFVRAHFGGLSLSFSSAPIHPPLVARLGPTSGIRAG